MKFLPNFKQKNNQEMLKNQSFGQHLENGTIQMIEAKENMRKNIFNIKEKQGSEPC